MPPRLPNRDDLGAEPSARTGFQVATVDTSAIGRGMQDLAAGMARFGAEVHAQAERQQRFDAEKRFQEFKWNETLAYDEASRNISAENVGTFADDWQKGYFNRAEEFYSSVPQNLQPEFDQKLFSVERKLHASALGHQYKQQSVVAQNQIDDAVANTFAPQVRQSSTDDLDGVVADFNALLDSDTSLSPLEKDAIRRQKFRELALAHIDAMEPETAALVMDTWAETGQAPHPIFETLSDDDRQKVADAATRGVQAKQKEAERLAKESYDDQLDRIKIQAYEGGFSENDLDAMVESGQITDYGDIKAIRGAIEDGEEERHTKNLTRSILAGEGTVNIFNSDDRKALNGVYQDAMASTDDPAVQMEIAKDLVRRSGYVPDDLVDDIRAGLVSDDDDALLKAMALADSAITINRNSFAGRDGAAGVAKTAEFYRAHRDLGYSPEQIVSKYRMSKDPEQSARRDALVKEKGTKKWLDDEATGKNVLNVFDTSWLPGGEPEFLNDIQGAAAAGEYRILLEDALVETGGDRDAGKEIADARMRRIYGGSALNLQGRDILMRHPPEHYYPAIDGGHDYVEGQLRELVAGVDGLEPELVFLQPDEYTENDIASGRLPRYQVWYLDEFGRPTPLLGGHFVPDVELAKEESNHAKGLSPEQLNEIYREQYRNPPDFSQESP